MIASLIQGNDSLTVTRLDVGANYLSAEPESKDLLRKAVTPVGLSKWEECNTNSEQGYTKTSLSGIELKL